MAHDHPTGIARNRISNLWQIPRTSRTPFAKRISPSIQRPSQAKNRRNLSLSAVPNDESRFPYQRSGLPSMGCAFPKIDSGAQRTYQADLAWNQQRLSRIRFLSSSGARIFDENRHRKKCQTPARIQSSAHPRSAAAKAVSKASPGNFAASQSAI